MKDFICAATGVIGAAVASAFGGWSAALTALVICMSVDYLTGVLVAGVFHTSEKTKHGGLESRAGWKGLVRKIVTLLVVLVAYQMDKVLEVNYIKDAASIAFCANEILSITENAALMGLKLPAPITKAIELMRAKAEPEPTETGTPASVDNGVDYKAGYYNLLDELERARKDAAEAVSRADEVEGRYLTQVLRANALRDELINNGMEVPGYDGE
jgi:toxin secretion/phage lysis holin